MVPRPFTVNEDIIIKMLLKSILISIPSNNKYAKTLIPTSTLDFEWGNLESNVYVTNVDWWASSKSKTIHQHILVNCPTDNVDIKMYLLHVAPRLVVQAYRQLDYKKHKLTHFLNSIFNKDSYGSYKQNRRKVVRFYKEIREVYAQLDEFTLRGRIDQEGQYELKKKLYMQYGRALTVALRLYRTPL